MSNYGKEVHELLSRVEHGYSSHGNVTTWGEIKHIEVDERGNYDASEILAWEKGYNLTSNSRAIWVALKKKVAVAYDQCAHDYDNIMGMDDDELQAYIYDNYIDEPAQVDLSKGKIIVESDDGAYGFIFIFGEDE